MICSYGVSNLFEKMDQNNAFDENSRMETLGKITAGVAHDFNNILAAISGLAELIVYDLENNTSPEMEAGLSKNVTEYAKHILEAGAIGRSTVKDLQTLARPGQGKREKIDLHALLTNAISLVRGSIKTNITLHSFLDSPKYLLLGYNSSLQNVFLNLFLNARDAMPKGGKITIRTEIESKMDFSTGKTTEKLLISISDTGTGIPQDILQNIFDPFFTTKGEKGNGMGLANVLSTIQAHGGTISVNSNMNIGTDFFIRLPLAEEDSI